MTFFRRLRRWWTVRQERKQQIEMSPAWLKQQEQEMSRIEFHGPRWPWPIPRAKGKAE